MSNKAKIIEYLAQASTPLSGEQLSQQLGVSRTMVWKYIQLLNEEGYSIQAIKKKGYVLHGLSNQLTKENLDYYLTTRHFAREFTSFETCNSTQIVANEQLLQRDVAHGAVFVSEEQTAGKGRLNRPWSSSKGKGLWMTWVLKPNLLPHEAPPITLVVALAVAKAIATTTGIQVDIKWPNDLLIDGKKTGGILTELQATPDKIEAILVGIGLNVLHESNDFGVDLSSIATSLQLHCEQPVNRLQLLAAVASELESAVEQFETSGFQPFQHQWEQHSKMIGQEITATTVRETITGTAVGLNEFGALLVSTDDGVRTLFSGDVTLSGKLDSLS
ncbi:biotin--[acetyl-CoA-carboxylase] ligase [Chryseomicrobium sp. FSL W7-1435]|uniref:biotin--[acetyl-CoA-carboxylase] ligase n=1 Tax=Chryseomicrobium sp. FSL W7-1435 TaxID=2921704 RepID=UPI00315A49F4